VVKNYPYLFVERSGELAQGDVDGEVETYVAENKHLYSKTFYTLWIRTSETEAEVITNRDTAHEMRKLLMAMYGAFQKPSPIPMSMYNAEQIVDTSREVEE
jgi:hypothetical protein